MRAAIRTLPKGTYRYAIDTDGLTEPFRFELALTVKDSEIIADYTGTSPQQPRAINCPFTYTYAMTAYAVKCALLPTLPNNEGMFRPVKVVAPERSDPQPAASNRGRRTRGDRSLRARSGVRRAASGGARTGDGRGLARRCGY